MSDIRVGDRVRTAAKWKEYGDCRSLESSDGTDVAASVSSDFSWVVWLPGTRPREHARGEATSTEAAQAECALRFAAAGWDYPSAPLSMGKVFAAASAPSESGSLVGEGSTGPLRVAWREWCRLSAAPIRTDAEDAECEFWQGILKEAGVETHGAAAREEIPPMPDGFGTAAHCTHCGAIGDGHGPACATRYPQLRAKSASIPVGEVVSLNSGGPLMTVDKSPVEDMVRCTWFGDSSNEPLSRDFAPEMLEVEAKGVSIEAELVRVKAECDTALIRVTRNSNALKETASKLEAALRAWMTCPSVDGAKVLEAARAEMRKLAGEP